MLRISFLNVGVLDAGVFKIVSTTPMNVCFKRNPFSVWTPISSIFVYLLNHSSGNKIIRPSGSRNSLFSSRICFRKRVKGIRKSPITTVICSSNQSGLSSQLCSVCISSKQ